MPAAVFAVNEKQEILFMNGEARRLFKINDRPVNGQPITDVVKSNNLLNSILESKDGEHGVRLSHEGKASKYQVKKFEIVVPNIKPRPMDTLQFASYAAGMVYILKSTEQAQPDAVKA
jgi:hypothetical protein